VVAHRIYFKELPLQGSYLRKLSCAQAGIGGFSSVCSSISFRKCLRSELDEVNAIEHWAQLRVSP